MKWICPVSAREADNQMELDVEEVGDPQIRRSFSSRHDGLKSFALWRFTPRVLWTPHAASLYPVPQGQVAEGLTAKDFSPSSSVAESKKVPAEE